MQFNINGYVPKLVNITKLSIKLIIINISLMAILFVFRMTFNIGDILFFVCILLIGAIIYLALRDKIASILLVFSDAAVFFLMVAFLYLIVWQAADYGVKIYGLSNIIDLETIGMFYLFQLLSLISFILVYSTLWMVSILKLRKK